MQTKESPRKRHQRLAREAAKRLSNNVTPRQVHTWAEHMKGALK